VILGTADVVAEQPRYGGTLQTIYPPLVVACRDSAKVKGYVAHPSHYTHQRLQGVWLEQ
jgi:hypothetical protein